MYHGNRPRPLSSDFLALSLDKGSVVFQFNPGDSELRLKSSQRITLNEWHTVAIWRHQLKGELTVDDQDTVSGEGQGRFTRLDLEDRLYLGGHVNYDHVHPEVAADSGYVGCVSQLSIRPGYDLDLYDDALDQESIGSCVGDRLGCPCQLDEVCVLRSNDFICHSPGNFSEYTY